METDSPILQVISPVDHCFWESPDKSVAIYTALDVIEAVNQAILRVGAAAPVHRAEIGGLLLGRAERAERLTVWIDFFEPIACSYPRGPSWLLNEAEQDELGDALAERPRAQVVGFFRSHTRKDLFLSEEDLSFAARFFAEPESVFLVVKPFTTRPNLAGFFYWENGEIHGSASYCEFAFVRAEPGGGSVAPLAVPAAREWVRELNPQLSEAHVEERFAPFGIAKKPKRSAALMWVVPVAALVMASAVAGYLVYRPRTPAPLARAARRVDQVPGNALALSVSQIEQNFTLTWDRQSPVIGSAKGGVLAISEGSLNREIALTAEQLHTGGLVYAGPVAAGDIVSFRLRIETGQGEVLNAPAVEFIPRLPTPVLLAATPVPVKVRRVQAAKVTPAPVPEIVAAAPVLPAPPLLVTSPKAEPRAPIKIVRPEPRREP